MGVDESRGDRMSGRLYGIGVGPGDPELMTLKAVRMLREVPVVAYPAPDDGESSARKIAAAFIPGRADRDRHQRADARRTRAARTTTRAAEQIAAHLEAGRDVAVLCEGDPFFYGSFMYLHDLLAPRFPTTVVPGVTSLTACAAAANRPLVRRDDVLAVLPATLPDDALEAPACERRRRGDPEGRAASAAAEGAARAARARRRQRPMSRMPRAATSASFRSPSSTRTTRRIFP